MTGLDTNILVEYMVSSSANHRSTVQYVQDTSDHFCITPVNSGEVLRILTHPKVFREKALNIGQAVDLLNSLLESLNIQILDEDTYWWKGLTDLGLQDLRGNEIFDARVALCLQSHNVSRLITRDSDFRKYRFLKTLSP